MLKTPDFHAQNVRTAGYILQDPARFGPASLLAQWAKAVLERAPVDAAPKPEAQASLFTAEVAQ